MSGTTWLARFVAGGMAVAATAPQRCKEASAFNEPRPKTLANPTSFQPNALRSGVAMDGGCNIAILAGLAVIPLVVLTGLHADPNASFVTPERAASLSMAINDFGHWIRLI